MPKKDTFKKRLEILEKLNFSKKQNDYKNDEQEKEFQFEHESEKDFQEIIKNRKCFFNTLIEVTGRNIINTLNDLDNTLENNSINQTLEDDLIKLKTDLSVNLSHKDCLKKKHDDYPTFK